MKKSKILIPTMILVWIIAIIAIMKSRTRLTYLEYEYINENEQSTIELQKSNDVLEQEFTPSYDILHGMAVLIGTYGRDNNSIWTVSIIQKDTGKTIVSKDYNASLINDESFHLFKFPKNIKVDRNKQYLLRIAAKKVSESTGIQCFAGTAEGIPGAIFDGEALETSLCFAEYGGNTDNWWTFYYLLLAAFVSIAVIRANIVISKGEKLLDDKLFGSLMAGFLFFIMMYSFAAARGPFTDESDNIRGGMIIARGGVIYRDYVTQHTPFMYYLCGLFALLGADSIEQFRLMYYMFEALIWGGLYHRHSEHFGKIKMLLLTALECAIVTTVFGKSQGCIIVSDGFQGICMVALLFEFLRYYDDKKLDWDRAIIVSLSIWGSVGSAFISVYPISVVVVAVLGFEIAQIAKKELTVTDSLKRFGKLLLCSVIPPLAAIVYFGLNHSLKQAYEQAYLFNREVYTQYIEIGDNIFEPYLASVSNFFGVIVDRVIQILNSETTSVKAIQPVIMIITVVVLITMLTKKRYAESLVLFFAMIFSASREYTMHGMAAWYVSVMIIVLFGYELLLSGKKAIPVCVIISIFVLNLYAKAIASNLVYEQEPISEIDSRIVSITDDNEGIIMDVYCNDSIYLLYKNRFPLNRACYMLPWYMDWYEQDNIDALNTYAPRLVIFNSEQETWEQKYYSNAFYTELKKNYMPFSDKPDDGWKSLVWIRTAN